MVRTGQAHLGVTVLGATPDGFAVDVLTDVGQSLIVPRTHRLAVQPEVTLRDLQGEALIVPPPGRPHRTMIETMLMNAGVAWQLAVEANGWELMLHFAQLRLGLAIVNGCCRPLAGLVARPLAELPQLRYQIVRRAGSQPHPAAEALRTLLLAHVKDWHKRDADD